MLDITAQNKKYSCKIVMLGEICKYIIDINYL